MHTEQEIRIRGAFPAPRVGVYCSFPSWSNSIILWTHTHHTVEARRVVNQAEQGIRGRGHTVSSQARAAVKQRTHQPPPPRPPLRPWSPCFRVQARFCFSRRARARLGTGGGRVFGVSLRVRLGLRGLGWRGWFGA